MGSRDEVLRQIAGTGFVPQGHAIERPRGFVFRWSVAVAFVLAWNLLALVDMKSAFDDPRARTPGIGIFLACAFAFAMATAIKRSPRVQRFVLANGHAVGEVRPALTLIQLVTGAMALGGGIAVFFMTR